DFFEGFEDMTMYENMSSPDCWNTIYTVSNNWSELYADDYEAKSGDQSMYVYRGSGAGDFMLVSPETDNLGNGAKRIRFSVYLDYSYPEVPEIEIYSLDGNTASATKTLIEKITLSDDPVSPWQDFTVVLPTTTDDYFAFSFPEIQNGGYGYFYIDDVYYEDIPAPTITTTQKNNPCHGGTSGVASAVVSEGVAPISYLWDTGDTTPTITGLAAGSYTLVVTDAINRTATTTVSITESNAISSNAIITDITCNGAAN